ncbi:MAG: Exocyst complex component Sec6 [Phormidium sp. OSCR]|nr:MAG: Exocyst complex component Sec6 [Phormidium sp. OSCR]
MSSNILNPQVELKIQRGIRQVEDQLVVAIQKALEESQYGNLEDAQFRNLVRVAESTDSTEVIKNFLLYQVGRQGKGEEKWGRSKNSLANQIIDDIDNVLKDLAQVISEEVGQEFYQQIWLDLIRRYLGYGSRRLKYINFLKSESKQQKSQTENQKENSFLKQK